MMFLSNGTIGLSLVALAAAIRTVSADGLFTDPLLFSYEPYDSGNTKTLLVSYRDDSAHENVVNYTKKMKGDGRQVKEKNHTLKKAHKLQRAAGSSGDKKAKSDKDRRLRWLQEDQAIMAGFSVLELETDDLKAEIAALSAIEGVTAVEEDSMMHIMSMEYDQKLRGGGGVAEHIREIQDAISATADELPEEDVEAQHGRRLAEETPYGINMVNASHVWPETPLANIKICVVDTGYDLGHVDLPTDGVQGYNQYNQLWSNDGNSHGTHCAGTIGAIGGNDIGVTSVNPDPSKFTFYIGKGLSDSGSGSNAGVMAAVQACVEAGAKVISMSLGGGSYSSIDNAAYEDIYDQDVLIVAAAGNSGNSALSYPASYPSLVSVASLTSSGTRSSFSQYNDQVEISGPGSAVKSTVPGNNYDTYSGTSMACPHVAGVAALLWSHFPDCTNNQIRNAMINSSVESGSVGWDKYYGWGRVNAGNAYELLKNGCEVAGGDSNPPAGEGLSYFALGGKDQGVPPAPPTAPPTPGPTVPCPGAQQRFEVQIITDNYPGETTWTLTDKCDASIGEMMSGGPYSTSSTPYSDMSACANDGQYEFKINDSFGDGVCCAYGQGSYEVKFGTEVKASGGEFGSSETKIFGTCGPTTPPPSPSPTTPPPSSAPTSPPSPSPTTAPPTRSPTLNPTPVPTVPPTPLPTQVCSAISNRNACNNTSGRCTWSGSRRNGTCGDSGGGDPCSTCSNFTSRKSCRQCGCTWSRKQCVN
ncbi:subtilase family serine peptidase [Skeletonema marinoi]|uniref:subtilisin n=1 Tax=Skeletonema marinoi TaxID=267567 RepID=A0AAD8YHQ2_9STRA|nr:subtilase family serine peptidase [Skeletonema marinoi]